MEGDGLLHPRGPLPSGVYWRRRLIVLAAALVVLVVLAESCGGGGKGKGKGTKKTAAKSSTSSSQSPKPSGTSSSTSASPKPSASQSSKPAATTSTSPAPSTSSSPPPADASKVCTAPALQFTVKTDATQYAAGVTPVITMTIKNAGAAPCTRDIGSAATSLVIKSGTDRIWSSDDCLPGGGANKTVFKPGDIKTIAVTWNRKRSKPGTPCVGAAALPGHYRVFGQLGDVSAAPVSFDLS